VHESAIVTTRTFADAGVPAAIEGKADVEEAGSSSRDRSVRAYAFAKPEFPAGPVPTPSATAAHVLIGNRGVGSAAVERLRTRCSSSFVRWFINWSITRRPPMRSRGAFAVDPNRHRVRGKNAPATAGAKVTRARRG
jgi:hypothetical protein